MEPPRLWQAAARNPGLAKARCSWRSTLILATVNRSTFLATAKRPTFLATAKRSTFLAIAKRSTLLLMTGLFLLSATRCDAQFLHKKKKVNKSTSAENTAEPDKVLYDKAMGDVRHVRHEVSRLNLQTLINTYPDTEYLAKANLPIPNSFYKTR